jgi:hypothetical protein
MGYLQDVPVLDFDNGKIDSLENTTFDGTTDGMSLLGNLINGTDGFDSDCDRDLGSIRNSDGFEEENCDEENGKDKNLSENIYRIYNANRNSRLNSGALRSLVLFEDFKMFR